MKLFRFLLLMLSILPVSIGPFDPDREALPEIIVGPLQAQVGLSPLTNTPSGWYTSDVTMQILAPADVLANGKPIKDGKLIISDEGRHEIELQPGPFGQADLVTQIVDIDKTAPRVTWLTEPNSAVFGYSALSAEISDATSGICSVENSLDHGHTWETQFLTLPGSRETQVIHETTLSLHRNFADFEKGVLLIQLRAHDCAGNVSPGEILVVRVE
jgi:hypothetical protein